MNLLDTEILKFMIIKELDSWNTDLKNILENILWEIDGSCNIAIIRDNWDLSIAKYKNDFHPLAWSKKDGVFLFSSESWALYSSWCEKINYMKAWEVVEVKNWKVYTWELRIETEKTPCVFELIYFSSPESAINWIPVSRIRSSLWRELAIEQRERINRKNSIVVDVPSSSHYQTKWFSQELWIPIINAITKNPESNRTFFSSKDSILDKVKRKYIFNTNMREFIEWKEFYLVDDSLVRGNTMLHLVETFKKFYRPAKVHLTIPSPPIIAPCFYGINMPSQEELFVPWYLWDLRNPKDEELKVMA